uniref:FII n=1 Tax=Deinagkistrodon acutus TaxID=36307 RepID=UPI0000683902|nr:Chain A, Fii [Deinagkistrodon acutus]
ASPQVSVTLQLVVDSSMFAKYNGDAKKIVTVLDTRVNIMKSIFKPLLLLITLSGIEMWTSKDLITVKPAGDLTLSLFADWRQTLLLSRILNDNAQLQTAVDFRGAVVGLAFVGTMCNAKYSAGIIQDFSAIPLLMAVVMAHELGHNLGMLHDDGYSCDCDVCIMAPSLSSDPTKVFSNCSLILYEDFLSNEEPDCIDNASNN